MRNLVIKIKRAIQQIEREKGPFKLKCLVANDLSDMRWDLVLSADWFEADPTARLDYLSERILGDFDIDCMIQFSGIITYDVQTNNPLIEKLTRVQENHRLGKFANADLGQGYVVVDYSHDEIAKWIVPLNDPES